MSCSSCTYYDQTTIGCGKCNNRGYIDCMVCNGLNGPGCNACKDNVSGITCWECKGTGNVSSKKVLYRACDMCKKTSEISSRISGFYF